MAPKRSLNNISKTVVSTVIPAPRNMCDMFLESSFLLQSFLSRNDVPSSTMGRAQRERSKTGLKIRERGMQTSRQKERQEIGERGALQVHIL